MDPTPQEINGHAAMWLTPVQNQFESKAHTPLHPTSAQAPEDWRPARELTNKMQLYQV
jgi:hypothetical protein